MKLSTVKNSLAILIVLGAQNALGGTCYSPLWNPFDPNNEIYMWAQCNAVADCSVIMNKVDAFYSAACKDYGGNVEPCGVGPFSLVESSSGRVAWSTASGYGYCQVLKPGKSCGDGQVWDVGAAKCGEMPKDAGPPKGCGGSGDGDEGSGDSCSGGDDGGGDGGSSGSCDSNGGGDSEGQAFAGNPINIGTGNKTEKQLDIVLPGSLRFERIYNSATSSGSIGSGWHHSFDKYLAIADGDVISASYADGFRLVSPTGRSLPIHVSNTNWSLSTEADFKGRIAINSGITDVRYLNADNRLEQFDLYGKLLAIYEVNGQKTTAAVVGGYVTSMTDTFGRSISIGYDPVRHRPVQVTDPAGHMYRYNYDGNGNLSSVVYPDENSRQYHYENPGYPHALTGMTDEGSARFATWTYDSQGRAYSSQHAGGANATTLNFGSDNTTITDALGTNRTVNFSTLLGVRRSTGSSQPAGAGCSFSSSGQTYDNNGNIASRTNFNGYKTTYVYDQARNLQTSRTEGLNGDGTLRSETRTFSSEWHAYWSLPKRLAGPKFLVNYVYNGDVVNGTAATCAPATATVPNLAGGDRPIGVVCSRTEQATTDANGSQGFAATATGVPRVWNYTYDAYGNMLTADGPRTDVADTTTYTYHPFDDPVLGKRGNLKSVTDALSHTTQFPEYDDNGRLLTKIDQNGITTTFTYWPRGWLKTRIFAGKQTSYDYTPWGGLRKISYPDGTWVQYGYDDAHRLTSIGDSANRQVIYTLDGLGNRKKDEYLNADGSVAKQVNRVFDALGRLKDEIEGAVGNAPRTYGYYANGEGKFETSPKQDTTSYEVDGLGRTVKKTDPVNGAAKPTLMNYDSLDQLSGLTAPNSAATGFTVDGLGNVTQETSADRGTINATYDAAGNLKTRTDARNVTETYTWDALNRLTVKSNSAGQSVTYTWDAGTGCTNGIGRLCQVVDANSTTRYAYDTRGNLVSQTLLQGGETFTTTFAYNDASRALDVITPTAETLTPTLDAAGRINQIAASNGATTSTLTKDIDYSANGQIKGQTLGRGTGITQSFDSAGRPDVSASSQSAVAAEGEVPLPLWALGALGAAMISTLSRNRRGTAALLAACVLGLLLHGQESYAGTDLDLNYDANGNVIQKITPGGTITFTYDALDRIDTEAGPAGNRNHDFDANDNRTSDGAGITTSFTSSTDRLATVNGVTVALDAAGNLIGDGTYKYVWDGWGNLAELRKADNTLLATYTYDADHKRIKKVTTAAAAQGASTTFYHYDLQGRLLGESAPGNQPKATYVWNGDTLTGFITYNPRTAYTVQTDQIGSPFQIRTLDGTVVWRWESEAFGRTSPNEDVDGNGQVVTFNLRFPGQYFDKESGLHYNRHRYYSPKLARYISADPIGIAAGNNVYAYVSGNPLAYFDEEGLMGRGPGKGERGYTGGAGGTSNPGKHWKDDPNKPGWGWQKDPQTGKDKYKKKPPYIPEPEDDGNAKKSEECGPTCAALLVTGFCILCALQPEICLPAAAATALAQ